MELITINTDKQSLNNVCLGKNTRIFNFVNAYGCSIDDNSKIGAFVEIQKGATIGKNCKISSHTFICEGVHIEDNVFVGHGVMFTNDLSESHQCGWQSADGSRLESNRNEGQKRCVHRIQCDHSVRNNNRGKRADRRWFRSYQRRALQYSSGWRSG